MPSLEALTVTFDASVLEGAIADIQVGIMAADAENAALKIENAALRARICDLEYALTVSVDKRSD
jgi:regulator of replication initiation timing